MKMLWCGRSVAVAGLALGLSLATDAAWASDPYAYNGGTSSSGYGAGSDWRGAYVGAHAGGGIGRGGPLNTSGFVGGVQAGFNAQADRVVIGVEGDVSLSSVDNKGYSEKYRQRWLGSLRGRAGYTFDRLLVYGTAGIAGSGQQYKDSVTKSDKTHVGWVIGAGAELQLSRSISMRGEFLRYELGSERYYTTARSGSIDTSTNVLRGGVNLRF
ncbi:outer membrane beta-barrel protein [Chelatococcus sp. SYSU_G07232]|uniref:Outer membrane beta-barrel protein n=1 Tax=Chelatococcus albus TaxID=3047466 RepID=A0ABT7AJJ3_9HYPH|nr:outer membrane beta-barrel protein [Chelatococcus sp. SYSU_G07232]MDJ1159280.1 outer membrane beta-barrel protein [Chelatococcus sp. SYSU_G07232]